MSMNPGATTCPVASRVRLPSRPPRMIRSALMMSALSTGQVCPDSGVVGQVDQAAGPVGRRLVGDQPRPEPVFVPVLGCVEPDLAAPRRLDEHEVDALG